MNSQAYFNQFVKMIEPNFDIEYNKSIFGLDFDMTAVFNQRSAKYMLVKSAEIYAFGNHEYLFYKKVDGQLKAEQIEEMTNLLNEHVYDIIELDDEHMSSTITFVFCTDEIPNHDVINKIKKFKFYKSFKLGLKGWVNSKMILINPTTQEVITNRLAKDMQKKIFPKSR